MPRIAHDVRDEPTSHSVSPGSWRLSDRVTLMVDHGADLLAMARLITGDDQMAREAVVHVVAQATPVQVSPAGAAADSEIRRVLADALFAACWSVPVMDNGCEYLGWAASAAAYQRAALALYVYGCHTAAQTGELLDLPDQTVRQSLVATLSELATAVSDV